MIATEDRAPSRRRRPARFATSKFAVPEPFGALLPRPALVGRLDRAAGAALRVVVGPAGSGKSTVLAQWARSRPPGTVCWMQADRGDADAVRCWQAIVHAVRTVVPGFAEDALELLLLDDEVAPDALEAVLTASERLAGVVLVIDDAHLIGAEVHQHLRFLLDRGFGGLELALGSRRELAVGLDRLRAAGRLFELRDVDLRLDRAEAGALVGALAGPVDPVVLDSLVHRTQGWAAGLHLAALALQSADADEVIDGIGASSRSMQRYLLDEVLDAQPPALQRFLLDTCVVDELTPQLAGALHGGVDVGLADVEAANLLTTRVDPSGGVLRHHPLVLDTLRAHLHQREPARERELHRRAAAHYEAHGDIPSAFRHRWLAGRPIDAAELIDIAGVFDTYFANRLPEIDPDAHAFADHDIRTAPGACIGYCAALAIAGYPHEADRLAARIAELAGADLSRSQRIPLLSARALIAMSLCDIAAAVRFCEELMATVDGVAGDPRVARWVSVGVGMTVRAHVWAGQIDLAERFAERLRPYGDDLTERIEHAGALAQLRLEQGRPAAALELSTAALASIVAADLGRTWEDVAPRAVRGGALMELGQLDEARAELEAVVASDSRSRVAVGILARLELARLLRAEGSPEPALRVLDDARRLVRRPTPGAPILRRIAAHEAALLVDLGELDRASALIEELAPGVDRSVLRARLHLVVGRSDLAGAELEALPAGPTTLRRALDLAAVRLRVALASDADHDDLVDAVLDLAGEGGLVFQLAEASAEAFPAVCRTARRRPVTPFLEAVLRMLPHVPPAALAQPDWPAEALTDRERTVLRYVATSMSYSEIAAELYISVNTVKTHVKSIIRKLRASSRADAIQRARSLRYL